MTNPKKRKEKYMDLILFILTILAFSINYFMFLSSNIHIYQLNHYKDKFQLKWIAKNFKKLIIKNIGIFLIIPLMFLKEVGIIISILIFLLQAYINKIKDAKIQLVYTNRAKRLIITGYIFAFAIIVLLKVLFQNQIISLISMPIITLLTPILILLFNIINKPINNIINKKYINGAKQIIQNMPNLTVIGVTGSYGKTSMKNFLYKILSEKYNVLVTPENYNTTLGVVKTIRENLNATHNIFICEMGACNIGDIKEICDIVKPKYGVITSIGHQHLESFLSIENIIKTKFELADALPTDGIVFLNYDNEYISKNNTQKEKVTYGTKGENEKDYMVYDIQPDNIGIKFKMKDENNNDLEFTTKVIGEHNVINLAGAIAVANKLGISMHDIAKRVKQIQSVPHRLQVLKKGNNIIIDDAYNSNPNGAKSALKTLAIFDGIKILVTPGMIELGKKQYELNCEFGIEAAKVCDYIVLVGKEQTKPIYDGILKTEFDKQKIIIVEDIKIGLEEVYKIQTGDKQKIILLENDLPDNY